MCIRSINVVFLICAFVSLAAFGFQMGYHWVPSDYRTPSAPAWTLPCLVYLIFGYTRQVVRKSPVEGVKFFWIVSGAFNASPVLFVLFQKLFIPPDSLTPWSNLFSGIAELYRDYVLALHRLPQRPMSAEYLAELVSYGVVMFWMPIATILSFAILSTLVRQAPRTTEA